TARLAAGAQSGGLPGRPVARGCVQQVIGGEAWAVVLQRPHTSVRLRLRVRQERSKLPGLKARGLAGPEVQRVQMPSAVMAKQAVHMRNAQEGGGDADSHLVDTVLDGESAGNVAADQKID